MGLGIRRKSRDVVERLLSRFGLLPMIPPPDIALGVGHGDFEQVGHDFLEHFKRMGGLQPGHSILDVGCGTGRMAIPLTRFLSRTGRYRGFDVDREAVTRCRNRITPRFPDFQFVWADLFNQAYNPTGRTKPAEYTFPYANAEFDFVFLTSVFTHMLPEDVTRFLAEIGRVLKPGGTCFATFFVLSEESRAAIASGRSSLAFQEWTGGCMVTSRERPEDAIAYPKAAVNAAFASAGLQIREPIHFGSWADRPAAPTYQDVVVAAKR